MRGCIGIKLVKESFVLKIQCCLQDVALTCTFLDHFYLVSRGLWDCHCLFPCSVEIKCTQSSLRMMLRGAALLSLYWKLGVFSCENLMAQHWRWASRDHTFWCSGPHRKLSHDHESGLQDMIKISEQTSRVPGESWNKQQNPCLCCRGCVFRVKEPINLYM